MKLFYFAATTLCGGMFAGLVSNSPPTGFFAALAVWWVQLSLDAIVNGIKIGTEPAPSVPANCEAEL